MLCLCGCVCAHVCVREREKKVGSRSFAAAGSVSIPMGRSCLDSLPEAAGSGWCIPLHSLNEKFSGYCVRVCVHIHILALLFLEELLGIMHYKATYRNSNYPNQPPNSNVDPNPNLNSNLTLTLTPNPDLQPSLCSCEGQPKYPHPPGNVLTLQDESAVCC